MNRRKDEFLELSPLQTNRFSDLSEVSCKDIYAPNTYAQPLSDTYATFDSFTTESGDLISFQITTNPRHGLVSSGIIKALEFRERCKKSTNPLRVYFVVPTDRYPSYPLQPITYADEEATDLESRIRQYALEMPWNLQHSKQ